MYPPGNPQNTRLCSLSDLLSLYRQPAAYCEIAATELLQGESENNLGALESGMESHRCIISCPLSSPDSGQPYGAAAVWGQRKQVGLWIIFFLEVLQECRYCYAPNVNYVCFLGAFWRNRNESKLFWRLCRPAGPNPNSSLKWKKWSPLLKSNNWIA